MGADELTAIHLVGHTPGSIALLYQDPEGIPHLFTGDCLFPGGVGNTQKDPERFASLYEGVVSKIFDRLPDSTWVYPGHGKDTTLGTERNDHLPTSALDQEHPRPPRPLLLHRRERRRRVLSISRGPGQHLAGSIRRRTAPLNTRTCDDSSSARSVEIAIC